MKEAIKNDVRLPDGIWRCCRIRRFFAIEIRRRGGGKKNLPFRRTPESVRIALRCKLPSLCDADRFPRSREWNEGAAEFRKKTAKFREPPPSLPRKRESILRNKTANSPRFPTKKRRERGDLSVKMDSRFRGNDGGKAGFCRQESDGGGGDSDLHRNGKK